MPVYTIRRVTKIVTPSFYFFFFSETLLVFILLFPVFSLKMCQIFSQLFSIFSIFSANKKTRLSPGISSCFFYYKCDTFFCLFFLLSVILLSTPDYSSLLPRSALLLRSYRTFLHRGSRRSHKMPPTFRFPGSGG